MTTTQKAARQAAAPFSLDFAPPRRRHDDATRYCVWCLWLIGLSAGSIAKTLLIPRSAVLGLIARSDYAGRSSMTDQERRILLSELRDIRFEDGRPLDGGRLDGINWTVQPLSPAKIRPPKRRMS